MCGRLSLFAPADHLEERFGAELAAPLTPRYNVAPRDDVAVIRAATPGTIERCRWGLIPSWADDDATGFINARAETVERKPAFREAYRSRRCLVLADGFYEWAEVDAGPKQPYRVARVDGEPFAMAGLYERWDGDDGGTIGTATVLTCEPNDLMADLHDRMPVVLPAEEERCWLDPDCDDLLAPRAWPDFHAYPIARTVNDPSNDSPAIVEEVDPDEQTGLDDFV